MTLTGMKKHVSVLEQAGLLTTQKVGRVRTLQALRHRGLEQEAAWIERYRQLLGAALRCVGQGRRGIETGRKRSMGANEKNDAASGKNHSSKNRTTVERTSERELVVTRTFNAPVHIACSRPGASPSCSSSGGRRSRLACRVYFLRDGCSAPEASIVSCSATRPRRSRDGVFRPVHRSDPELPHRLDE